MTIRNYNWLTLTVALSISVSSAIAQTDYSSTLNKIVAESRVLKTAALRAEATQDENMTGLNLSDPEVDFIYQWGDIEPDKVMLDVTQSFDFATLSGAKKKLARQQNLIADAELKSEKVRILSEADALMTRAVYCRRLEALYSEMEKSVARLYEATLKAMDKGDVSVIEVNSMKVELANMKAERKINLIELKNVMSQLGVIAGGKIPDWNGEDYMSYSLPSDFNTWSGMAAEKLPSVARALAEAASADAEIGLRKKENLPEFSLGYSSEMVKDDNHYGVKFGFTLPLWAGKGRVKAAKAAKAAAMANLEDERIAGLLNIRMKFEKAEALRESAVECAGIARECDNTAQITKLYESGSISESECLVQLQPLFTLSRQALDAEYSYQQALVDFRAAAAAY